MVALRTLSDNVLARFNFQPTFAVWDPITPPSPTPKVMVYDANIPSAPVTEQYVVVYPDTGGPFQDRLGDIAGGLDWGTTFVLVGRTRAQVATCVDNVRIRSRGWTPDPLGGAWVEQAIGARLLRDDTNPAIPLFSFTLRYTTTTRS